MAPPSHAPPAPARRRDGWTRRALVLGGAIGVAVAATSFIALAPADGPGRSGLSATTTTAEVASAASPTPSSTPAPVPVAAGIDPCALLNSQAIDSSTGGRYLVGQPLTRPDGAYCTFERLDAPGEVTVSLYTQARLDAEVRQDPNMADSDLRGVLERTKALAEVGPSDYVRSTGIGDVGYEIGSTDPARTDRLAVIAGDDLVVLAATDPSVSTAVVRAWMVAALERLAAFSPPASP